MNRIATSDTPTAEQAPTDRTRRNFLKVGALAGGGLLLGFSVPAKRGFAAEAAGAAFVPNAFLRIAPDGTVTVLSSKSEMGQGVYTGLAMLVAEELDADWSTIRVEPAPAAEVYAHVEWGIQMTGGSTSMRTEYDRYRRAGATARAMLIAAAAQRWNVPAAQCRTEAGEVLHDASGRRAGFGELATTASALSPPDSVTLKSAEQFRLLGRSRKRVDSAVKITGEAQFGIDVRLPGMRTAVIARAPLFGARLKTFDASAAKKINGVDDVVAIEAGVAVVADSFWSAKRGRDALRTEWDDGPYAETSMSSLREKYLRLAETPGHDVHHQGDVDAGFKSADKTVEAFYELPFLAHACMEPMNCVADVKDDGVRIWSGTQGQGRDQKMAATKTGLPPEAVEINTNFMGGGFGRKGKSDFVAEAVELSKGLGKPVKVVWTREDDTRGGFYRPMQVAKLRAALDRDGRPVAWTHRLVGASILHEEGDWRTDGNYGPDGTDVDETSVEGADKIPYTIANQAVDYHPVYDGVPVNWWRGVGSSLNAFVVESFIDELAAAAGSDPLEFRRALLPEDARERGVLELAAQKAGWGTPLPAGRARGIAVHFYTESYTAQVAEVSLRPDGTPRVHRVVCALDCGTVLNPDNARTQMESGIVYGLAAALYGEVTIERGRVQQGNFHDYRMLRMDEMPVVETHFLESGEALGGVGETATPTIAPAVTNALYALTGKRIRRLPIDPGELRLT